MNASPKQAPAPLAVAVVEDDPRVRSSLRLLIEDAPGLRFVAEATSIEEALLRWSTGVDVVLVDVELPGVRGSKGVSTLAERWPGTAFLMHTVHEGDEAIFESLCNGAVGYLLKRTAPARLVETIHEAHRGGAPMSPEIARRVIGLFRRVAPRNEVGERLLPQEIRLLGLLASGHGYAEAGRELGVSINTVRTYIRSIYEKLHVHTKSEAVAKAMRSGLI